MFRQFWKFSYVLMAAHCALPPPTISNHDPVPFNPKARQPLRPKVKKIKKVKKVRRPAPKPRLPMTHEPHGMIYNAACLRINKLLFM